jgi:DNA-binding MurR/RpiR family transcriptional regulator
MALESVVVIAERARVQPSAVVRFAQKFGFPGYSPMQRVYQSFLLENVSSYSERLRRAFSISGEQPLGDAGQILREFCAANTASLQRLSGELPSEDLLRAVKMLRDARIVHVMGVRRSFPVAAYLGYALTHAGCKAHLLSGLAGLISEQAQLMNSTDVLIAISAHPYAPETRTVAEAAAHGNVPIIALTDSLVSPLASLARLSLIVHETELRGFRSLTASLCLAQTVVVALAFHRAENAVPDKPSRDQHGAEDRGESKRVNCNDKG